MARKIFIAGNWKMNKTAAETAELASALKASLAPFAGKCEIAVCPTFTSLATAVEILKGSNVKVGAQNIHWADNGAYTGEMWVILEARPLLFTAATESPPPMMVVAPESATAWQTPMVPFAKLDISKQPMGPFQTTVFAPLMALE